MLVAAATGKFSKLLNCYETHTSLKHKVTIDEVRKENAAFLLVAFLILRNFSNSQQKHLPTPT